MKSQLRRMLVVLGLLIAAGAFFFAKNSFLGEGEGEGVGEGEAKSGEKIATKSKRSNKAIRTHSVMVREENGEERLRSARMTGPRPVVPELPERASHLDRKFAEYVQPATRNFVPRRTEEEEAVLVAKLEAEENRSKAAAIELANRLGEPLSGYDEKGNYFELVGLDENGELIYYETTNEASAISNNVSRIRETAPYGLNGSGWWVGVWDSESANNRHETFDWQDGVGGTRCVIYDFTEDDEGAAQWVASDHATHVAGTVGGGQDSASGAEGMAPEVTISSFDWDNARSEMRGQAASSPGDFIFSLYTSNHSYGRDIRGDTSLFGRYDSEARAYDDIVFDHPYYLPIKAAGNNNSNASNYDTIPTWGVAKNILTVGNCRDVTRVGDGFLSPVQMSPTSSFGPADDGRIKPDVIGNGHTVYSSTFTATNDSYGNKTGTSMSSPSVTGAAVLLQELYNERTGQYMLASSMKGLLIHTADDVLAAGPDYQSGWGLVNAEKAADHVIEHENDPKAGRLVEDAVVDGEDWPSYQFRYDGSGPLKATLVWTDVRGLVSSSNPDMVHDLDLRLVSPSGVIHMPFRLSGGAPAALATRGQNSVDNVEQVLVADATPEEGIWRVSILNFLGLSEGQSEQVFSLLVSNSTEFGTFKEGIDDEEFGPRDYTFKDGGTWLYDESQGINGDSARSRNIANGEETWFEATVVGPATVDFWWRTDCEAGFDFLKLYVDGVEKASRSGLNGSLGRVREVIPAGSHVVRWAYEKDGTISLGEDAGWVDQIRVFPNEVAEAVDQFQFDFENLPSGSITSWTNVAESGRKDGDVAQSGVTGPNQSSIFQTTIPGPAILRFDWKVSSEEDADKLIFANANGSIIEQISGEKDWRTVTVELPNPSNAVEWRYTENGSFSSGQDRGWVDNIRVVSSDLRVERALDIANFNGSTQFPLEMFSQMEEGWRGVNDSTAPSGDGEVALAGPSDSSFKSTGLDTTITGPGVVSFWWRVSGARNGRTTSDDRIRFSVREEDGNGTVIRSVVSREIIGLEGWHQVIEEIPEGTFDMSWQFATGGTDLVGPAEGALDGFTFTPGANNTNYPNTVGPVFPVAEGVEPLYVGIDNWGRQGQFIDAGRLPERWSTGGDAHWHSFRDTSNGGRDSATHGDLDNDESSWFEIEVQGPRTVFFDWKVSSEEFFDFLEFQVDGAVVSGISGVVGWTSERHEIPEGRHTLRWNYRKDGSASGGSDQGWVDGIAIMGEDFQTLEVTRDAANNRVNLTFQAEIFWDEFEGWSARRGYDIQFSEDLETWETLAEDFQGFRFGLTPFTHSNAPEKGFYRLAWKPERLYPIQNAGFEEETLNEGNFSYSIPGWKEGNATDSFVENFTSITAADGQNTVGLSSGTVLQSNDFISAGNVGIIGTVTLDVAVGNRPTWTSTSNRSIYGWDTFNSNEVNASLIPEGTFIEAPSLRWVPRSFDTSFSDSVRLEAAGGSRSHFDNIRVWVEHY